MGKSSSDPRQRLLDAGLKLFANRGYAGTAVQEITEEAKVTKPTLYYYFGNKEGLYQALVNQALDERLRLMRQAAPPEKDTVEQLTDILLAVTDFARREPDRLRLCFSMAFAATGEIPRSLRKHDKMGESVLFVHQVIQTGLDRGVFDPLFSVHELTQSYFHLVQKSTVLTMFEATIPGLKAEKCPWQMEARRTVELFLHGAARREKTASKSKTVRRLVKAALILTALIFCLTKANAQTTHAPSALPPGPMTNAAPTSATSADVPAAIPNPPSATAPPKIDLPAPTNAPPAGPTIEDLRPLSGTIKESHPELATVSPIEANSKDPNALDLETCFRLTAIRDDSLKISMQDIYIAQAQLSQSIAALWPNFTASNEQQFLHYRNGGGNSISILGNSTISGNRTYTSQSNIGMTYTIFNGGQNWNTVGASSAGVAAKKQTLARDYQTIYQSVAQAFYTILQYEGDLIVQGDLIRALQARVDDLKARVALGRSRPSEFLQAQTDCENAKVTAERQKGSLNAARETLAFYTGIPSGKFKLKETQKFPTAAQLEAYVSKSLNRPDILSQLESLRQAERNLSVAKGQLWPTVTANGNYLAQQDPATNQIDGTMTLQVSMPIFDGGLIIAQIRQNKELVRQSALNVENLKRTSDQDTRTAYVNFNASVAEVIVLREAAQYAAKNFQAQIEDYRRGVVSNLDVLTSLQDYQSARQQLHDSNMMARLNLINLHVAAGIASTGLGANNQALPLPTSGQAP